MAKPDVVKSAKRKMKDTEKWVQPEIKQGGFSDALWNSSECQKYVTSSCVAGYFGQYYRTIVRDRMIEASLEMRGLGPDGAACWLTSTSARHMMDSVDRNTPPGEFAAIANSATKDAFVEVTIWNHPDFGGNMASRMEMIDKLRAALEKY